MDINEGEQDRFYSLNILMVTKETGYDPYLHVLVWPSLSIRYDWTRSSPCTNRGGNCSIPAQGQVGASQCTSMGISW